MRLCYKCHVLIENVVNIKCLLYNITEDYETWLTGIRRLYLIKAVFMIKWLPTFRLEYSEVIPLLYTSLKCLLSYCCFVLTTFKQMKCEGDRKIVSGFDKSYCCWKRYRGLRHRQMKANWWILVSKYIWHTLLIRPERERFFDNWNYTFAWLQI